MLDYIISLSQVNANDEWEMKELDHKSNWFLTKDEPTKFDPSDIDKNFYTLCSLMEDNGSSNPHNYTVVQFYSKLDYINKKNARSERDTVSP